MPTPYSAKAVANFFLKKRKRKRTPITQMKLHKLLYYAHGWHLGFTGEPLLDEDIQAWQYGPVVPSIYHEFKIYGSSPIDRFATEFSPRELEYVKVPPVSKSEGFPFRLLKRVWKVYGQLPATRLSSLTHAPDSPWTRTRQDNPTGLHVTIPNERIRSHFEERIQR